MLHVDCHQHHGAPWFGGLLLSVFQSPEVLQAGMAALEALGVAVVNPHTYRLGGDQRLEELRAQATRSDPKGLLNPGKLFPLRAGAP
jgi:FAD/FMN-containing dehydrogenase